MKRLALTATLALAAASFVGCSARATGSLGAADAALDATAADSTAETDAGAEEDAQPGDAGDEDSGVPPDASAPDARAMDSSAPDAVAFDAITPDASVPDASAPDATAPDAGFVRTYRNSLSICWTDATCIRKLAVAHGGLWSAASAPYDSNAAIEAAYAGGIDGVKIDVRVTLDDVPVISHSSPLEIYESVDCYNRKIEEMTAAEVTQCHRFPSRTQTFQRLDDVLEYLRGKMVTQLTVKRSEDYARTIAEVLALGAEDFAFLEIDTRELQALVPTIPGGDLVWYLINLESRYEEIDTLIDTIGNPRAFMYEMNPSDQIASLVSTRLHPAGIRSFTYNSSATAGVRTLRELYEQGFDVVSAQTEANVTARIEVNQANGVMPP
ncbi:MAG: hypothetical protein HYV07_22185 [Deltaproteobacteria bacterium]|nr:hypothetical protein [Deltaproteobacteria bacterium]